MVHPRAGQLASAEDLVDLAKLEQSYFELIPDLTAAEQRVTFGTSGHRGSALSASFNEWPNKVLDPQQRNCPLHILSR